MEPSTAHVQWNGKVTPVKMMWTSVNQRQIHVRMEELVQTLKVVTTARTLMVATTAHALKGGMVQTARMM
jgi:hypothetical protein